MSWANNYIKKLRTGETVQFRPRGNSMAPLIESGQLVTVKPLEEQAVRGDIVLCKVNGRQYLHLVKGYEQSSKFRFTEDGQEGNVGVSRYLIGNNRGKINGWTAASNVYGIVTKVEPWKARSDTRRSQVESVTTFSSFRSSE